MTRVDLDLSPTTSDSLELAKNFNAAEFVAVDQKIGLKIRELKIKLEEAQARYSVLFGN